MGSGPYLTARQAAAELNVSVQTLYAYVSRGLLHSEPGATGERTRRYRRAEVRRLKQRREQRKDPSKAVEKALYWGEPVLDSAMTLITDGTLYYRGHDAVELARRRDLEDVAHLIWRGELPSGPTPLFAALEPRLPQGCLDLVVRRPRLHPRLHPVETFQILLSLAVGEDPGSYDLRPDRVVHCGARILSLMAILGAECLATPDDRRLQDNLGRFKGVAATLQSAWSPEQEGTQRLLNAALILCADHELNVSSFTARCVSSANSTPYGVVIAGLTALRGTRHGGHSERVEAFLSEMGDKLGVRGDPTGPGRGAPSTRTSVRDHLGDRLKRGERLPGFGHPLYPNGDPRCRALLALAEENLPSSPFLELAQQVIEEADGLIGEPPTIDFGLAALVRILNLPPGSALTLFALGRTVGWIGHALEQYGTRRLIRPRARYTGRLPEEGPPDEEAEPLE